MTPLNILKYIKFKIIANKIKRRSYVFLVFLRKKDKHTAVK